MDFGWFPGRDPIQPSDLPLLRLISKELKALERSVASRFKSILMGIFLFLFLAFVVGLALVPMDSEEEI